MDDYQVMLRRLTVRDDRFFASLLSSEETCADASHLDQKSQALVRIGALIAVDAAPQSYASCVEAARYAGVSEDEIVGTLIAAMPVVGVPRIVSAAPKLGLALGYDLDAALERDS
jgi:alkylhydroperoxidase/carboxymuconolactone decarboxylase family protein YurZ